MRRRNGEYLKPGSVPMLSDAERAAAQPIDIPRAEPKMAMQVIGIPLPQPGLYAVEIASTRLGQALHAEDKPYYVSGGALVTNLAVHFKHGRESSLAWVTRLDDGKPVGWRAGASHRLRRQTLVGRCDRCERHRAHRARAAAATTLAGLSSRAERVSGQRAHRRRHVVDADELE